MPDNEKAKSVSSYSDEQADVVERVLGGESKLTVDEESDQLFEKSHHYSITNLHIELALVAAFAGLATYFIRISVFFEQAGIGDESSKAFLTAMLFFSISLLVYGMEDAMREYLDQEKERSLSKLVARSTTRKATQELVKDGFPDNSVHHVVREAFQPTLSEYLALKGSKLSTFLTSLLATYYLLTEQFFQGEVSFLQVSSTILMTLIVIQVSAIVEKNILRRRAARGADRYDELSSKRPDLFRISSEPVKTKHHLRADREDFEDDDEENSFLDDELTGKTRYTK